MKTAITPDVGDDDPAAATEPGRMCALCQNNERFSDDVAIMAAHLSEAHGMNLVSNPRIHFGWVLSEVS